MKKFNTHRFTRLAKPALLSGIALSVFAPIANAQQDDLEPQHIDLDEIIVTASPFSRALGQTISGVSVLDGEALLEQAENSIGETLSSQPGISSTAFGAGASRPIIRGLGGDRIRVLEDSIGTFDAAQTSPDHAVPVEPALAQRVEVFRGAASLLYGSSAAGGVVNVDTGKIPSELPEGGIDGAVRYGHSTVNNGDEVAIGVNLAASNNIVLHGEFAFRDTDDYDIPGLNGSQALIDAFTAAAAEENETFDAEEEFTDGFVPNSDLRTTNGAGGISYIFDGPVEGFLGFSVSRIASNYAIPEGILTEEDLEEEEEGEEGEEGEEEGEEEGIRIDLDQIRYDLKGEFAGDFGLFEKIKLRVGYGNYQHAEVEGDEIATFFENDEVEGRAEVVTRPFAIGGGELRGAYGIQGRFRDFSALGAEAFVPPSEQTQIGIFALHDYRAGNLLIDLALRYENVSNSTDTFVAEEDGEEFPIDNDFNLFSVSGGVGYQVTPAVFVGVNGSRTERAPSLEESLSFGPHLATQSFEAGDPNLGVETATGVEATIRGDFGPLKLILNGFYTSYDNFIFEAETGEFLDGLPVFQFTGTDAEFRGFEAQADLDFGSFESATFGAVNFAGYAQADLVRATASDLDNPNIPRIPPLSSQFGLSADSQLISLRGEVQYVTAQDNIAAFELPTESYVFLNSYLTFRPFGASNNISFQLRAKNITNNEGRVAASFLKDTTPLPGRDIRFSVHAGF